MNTLSTLWLILRNGVEKYLVKNFQLFVPSSAGNSKLLGLHTKICIIAIFPLLSQLINILNIKLKNQKAAIFCKEKKKSSGK